MDGRGTITGMNEERSSPRRRRIHSSDRIQESSSEKSRRWEDMNPDILAKIFDGLSFFQLSRSLSSVCRSWQLVCWYKFFWGENKLNLKYLGPALGIVEPVSWSSYILYEKQNDKAVDAKLMKALRSIMEGYNGYGFPLEQWRWSIRTLCIPENFRILDQHLIYIAERTTRLERLWLFGSSRLTTTGFAKAASNWKNVKTVYLGMLKSQYVSKAIEEIGKNCSSLEFLCLCSLGLHLRQENASVIVKSLQQVKKLKFNETYLHRDGLKYIFSNPFGEVEIQFTNCYILDDEPPEPGQHVCHNVCRRTFNFKRKESDGKFCFVDTTAYLKTFLERWMDIETD